MICLTIRKVGNDYQKDCSHLKGISHIVEYFSRALLVLYICIVYFDGWIDFPFTDQIFNTT